MGTHWAPGRAKTLVQWWGTRVGDLFGQDLAAEGTRDVINLASQEYWAAIAQATPADTRVIAIEFMEDGPKGLRFNSFAAKRARGMMARYICEHRLTDVAALKGFDSDGYAHDASESDDQRWRFVRR